MNMFKKNKNCKEFVEQVQEQVQEDTLELLLQEQKEFISSYNEQFPYTDRIFGNTFASHSYERIKRQKISFLEEKHPSLYERFVKLQRNGGYKEVYGYKFVDDNLKCKDVQFKLNEPITQNGFIEECSNGLHFCEDYKDLIKYKNNYTRMFKIKALVPCCMVTEPSLKNVAKEITLLEEVNIDDYYDLDFILQEISKYSVKYDSHNSAYFNHEDDVDEEKLKKLKTLIVYNLLQKDFYKKNSWYSNLKEIDELISKLYLVEASIKFEKKFNCKKGKDYIQLLQSLKINENTYSTTVMPLIELIDNKDIFISALITQLKNN